MVGKLVSKEYVHKCTDFSKITKLYSNTKYAPQVPGGGVKCFLKLCKTKYTVEDHSVPNSKFQTSVHY